MKKIYKGVLCLLLIFVLAFPLIGCDILFGSSVKKISIYSLPDKTVYEYGEALDLAGGKILVEYNDEETEDFVADMDSYGITVSGYNKYSEGEQTLTVKYKSKTAGFSVTVLDEPPDTSLQSIAVYRQPDKLVYTVGENLDLAGGKLQLNFGGSKASEVINMTASGVTSSGYNKNSAGVQTVTVTYQSKSTTINVTVETGYRPEPNINSIQSAALSPHLIEESEIEENPVRFIDSVTETVDLRGEAMNNPTNINKALKKLLDTVIGGKKPILPEDSENPVTKVYNSAIEVLNRYIKNDFTEYERVHAIYDWVVFYIDYDYALLDEYLLNPNGVDNDDYAFHLSGAFSGLAVCDGISKAFSLLCAIEGIECERVIGWYEGADMFVGHAWNKVKIETPGNAGKAWYFVDSTFGNCSIYESAEKGYTEYLSHAYFLLTDEQTSGHYQDDWYTCIYPYTTIMKKSAASPSAGGGNTVYHTAETEWDYFAYQSVSYDGHEYLQSVSSIEELKNYIINYSAPSHAEALEIKLDFETDNDEIYAAFIYILNQRIGIRGGGYFFAGENMDVLILLFTY